MAQPFQIKSVNELRPEKQDNNYRGGSIPCPDQAVLNEVYENIAETYKVIEGSSDSRSSLNPIQSPQDLLETSNEVYGLAENQVGHDKQSLQQARDLTLQKVVLSPTFVCGGKEANRMSSAYSDTEAECTAAVCLENSDSGPPFMLTCEVQTQSAAADNLHSNRTRNLCQGFPSNNTISGREDSAEFKGTIYTDPSHLSITPRARPEPNYDGQFFDDGTARDFTLPWQPGGRFPMQTALNVVKNHLAEPRKGTELSPTRPTPLLPLPPPIGCVSHWHEKVSQSSTGRQDELSNEDMASAFSEWLNLLITKHRFCLDTWDQWAEDLAEAEKKATRRTGQKINVVRFTYNPVSMTIRANILAF
ncbi:unnamed protein product [Protopolystoma xenopodis]|uniref:Uncharacterized protein n=1 Tax=Protopolystoma xenopodis TaxID=117903 RepID=A0A448XDV1_9PLAT|nr:unnamed protein product [Protopolystoma xenopodis]